MTFAHSRRSGSSQPDGRFASVCVIELGMPGEPRTDDAVDLARHDFESTPSRAQIVPEAVRFVSRDRRKCPSTAVKIVSRRDAMAASRLSIRYRFFKPWARMMGLMRLSLLTRAWARPLSGSGPGSEHRPLPGRRALCRPLL
jgi:hypothetical protein